MTDDLLLKCKNLVKVAEDYCAEPEKYLRFFDVTINGKLRHLVTYQATDEGRKLRQLHNHFSEYLKTKYRQAKSSFAYRKGENILGCIERHSRGSVFLKTDIHSFFDSISFDRMFERLKQLNIPEDKTDLLAAVSKACFYQDKLPLGFTSSPVLSDLFLTSLDRKYQKISGIEYTRYADDFIVSVKDPDEKKPLIVFRNKLEKDLDQLGLDLNKKKTYFRELVRPGDAIHVLGLNIVKTSKGKNRITVSDRYIRDVSKAFGKWKSSGESEKSKDELLRIFGQISFIKNSSRSSYLKLKKLIRIKCNYSGHLTLKSLSKLG